jgi:hypothetical protein
MYSVKSIQKILTRAAVLSATIFIAGTAFAIDQPPQNSQQQRAWLVGHLVNDMEAVGTFDGYTAEVPNIVNTLTDDQVALLAQYFYLTRSKAEQDAYLYSLQQQDYTDEQINQAMMATVGQVMGMSYQIATYNRQFAQMPQPVQFLAQLCYASVPGWCCQIRCDIPEGYYDNGCYVGPCFNAAYAGIWAVPVCRVYYDHGSRFYSTYHKFANTVRINRNNNQANRHHNVQETLTREWLAHRQQNGSPVPMRPLPTNTQNHVAHRNVEVRNLHAPVAHVASNVAHTGIRNSVVHTQASKPQMDHVSTQHPANDHR